MLKNYLEIIEELDETEITEKQPQIIRLEVKDKAEATKKLTEYETAFKGLNYKKQMLIQNHYADADKNKPCEITNL